MNESPYLLLLPLIGTIPIFWFYYDRYQWLEPNPFLRALIPLRHILTYVSIYFLCIPIAYAASLFTFNYAGIVFVSSILLRFAIPLFTKIQFYPHRHIPPFLYENYSDYLLLKNAARFYAWGLYGDEGKERREILIGKIENTDTKNYRTALTNREKSEYSSQALFQLLDGHLELFDAVLLISHFDKSFRNSVIRHYQDNAIREKWLDLTRRDQGLHELYERVPFLRMYWVFISIPVISGAMVFQFGLIGDIALVLSYIPLQIVYGPIVSTLVSGGDGFFSWLPLSLAVLIMFGGWFYGRIRQAIEASAISLLWIMMCYYNISNVVIPEYNAIDSFTEWLLNFTNDVYRTFNFIEFFGVTVGRDAVSALRVMMYRVREVSGFIIGGTMIMLWSAITGLALFGILRSPAAQVTYRKRLRKPQWLS